MLAPKVVGIGQLMFDHIFLKDNRGIVYVCSRGGGTVSNVLANLTRFGIESALIGNSGTATVYGDLAKEELNDLGIDTQLTERDTRKNNLLIFQLSDNSSDTEKHRFFQRCLICGCPPSKSETYQREDYRKRLEMVNWEDVKFVFTDKLTNPRKEVIDKAKSVNSSIVSIIDIGYIGHLRYSATDYILQNLQNVDVLFINQNVFSFLNSRLSKLDGLTANFFQMADELKLILVTKGPEGLDMIVKDNETTHAVAIAPAENPITCSAGAGDALVANFIRQLLCDTASPKDLLQNAEYLKYNLNKSTRSLSAVLGKLGARGHLDIRKKGATPVTQFEGMGLADIQKQVQEEIFCPFCFRQNVLKSDIKLEAPIEKIVGTLPYRILNIFERQDVIDKCRHVLSDGQTYAVIGTGGSRSAAKFISQLITTAAKKASYYMYPYDYYRSMGHLTDWLIVTSYSGNTYDCGLAIRKAKELGVKRIALVTSHSKPKLAQLLENQNGPEGDVILSYGNGALGLEKGFLSFAGSVLPSILFSLGYGDLNIDRRSLQTLFASAIGEKFDGLEKFSEAIKKYGGFELLGGANAWPAMIDLESKIVEGGICAVQTHESKDFSHGRFMLSMKRPFIHRPKLLLQVGNDDYEDLLFSMLQHKSRSTPIIRIVSHSNDILGGLELLIRVQYFIFRLSKALYGRQKDITKPTSVPHEGLKLYRWKLG